MRYHLWIIKIHKKMQKPQIDFLNRLIEIIKEKKDQDPNKSYTAKLFAKGLPLITQKIGEEATEIVVAALAQNREDLIGEVSDLIYHLLILLEAKEIDISEVIAELQKRDHTQLDKI